MSIESAAKYIDEHRAARPWLAMTDHASPEARRIIAAMDAAGGHAHIRHEGWVTEEANRRRVTHREDPAQLDPEKRALSIDGLRPNDKRHRCGDIATRITDPDAFATAFVRGVEHPKVREALDMTFNPETGPTGDDPDRRSAGSGWPPLLHRLAAEASRREHGDCVEKRNAWIDAESRRTQAGRSSEPEASPVSNFEGGVISFMFAQQ